jgi:hypothetical protein
MSVLRWPTPRSSGTPARDCGLIVVIASASARAPARANDADEIQLLEPMRADGLFLIAVLVERDDDRRNAGADDVERRVVAALADGYRRSPHGSAQVCDGAFDADPTAPLCRGEQRDDLVVELSAAEREQLDDDGVGLHVPSDFDEPLLAFGFDVIDGCVAVHRKQFSGGVLGQRGKLDRLDALRRRETSG